MRLAHTHLQQSRLHEGFDARTCGSQAKWMMRSPFCGSSSTSAGTDRSCSTQHEKLRNHAADFSGLLTRSMLGTYGLQGTTATECAAIGNKQ